MASSPITTWQIEGEKVEEVTDFFFLGSKITVDSDCSHEIRWLLLGRKAMTNLDSVLKSRDFTQLTKVCIVKVKVFPVVMYGCESWTIKKAEGQNWCLETVVLEKTPETPLDSKDIQPINLKEDEPWIFTRRTDTEAEALVFWSSDVNRQLIGKSLMLGKIRAEGEEGMRGWDGWMASPMQWTWTWANRRWWGTGMLQSMGWQSQTWLGDWTTTTITCNGKESGENMYVYKYDESLAVYLKQTQYCKSTVCSLPASSVQGIFQARKLAWVLLVRKYCHFLLQGIFLTQGPNPSLLHYRQILSCLSHQGSPKRKI